MSELEQELKKRFGVQRALIAVDHSDEDQQRAAVAQLAADYLVMAAWLAYLKSRLLLPEPPEDEPSGEEMAANLQFQLQRLEAMQAAGVTLLARPRLGWDVFRRGMPEVIEADKTPRYEATLYDLLQAYADQKRRTDSVQSLRIAPTALYSVEDALERLEARLGRRLRAADFVATPFEIFARMSA